MNRSEQVENILAIFARWRSWLRAQRALRWATRGLLAGLSLALIPVALLLLRASLTDGEFLPLQLSIGLVCGLVGGLAGYFWPLDPGRAARLLDRSLELKDRLSTALEIIERDPPDLGQFAERQLADTLSRISQTHPRETLRWRPVRLELLVVLVLLVASGSLYLGGRELMILAAERRSAARAIQAEVAELERLISEIEGRTPSDPQTEGALLEALEIAREDLGEAENLGQAVSALDGAMNRLQALADPVEDEIQNTLASIAARAEPADYGGPALKAFKESLVGGDLAGASEALTGLKAGELSPEDRAALAAELQDMAAALPDDADGLATQLSETAEALDSGNAQQQEQALDQLGERMAQLGDRIEAAELSEETMGLVSASQVRLLTVAQSDLGPEDGEGSSAESVQSETVVSNGSSEQPVGQPGDGRGDAEGELSEGGAAETQPLSPLGQPGDGGVSDYDKVFAPELLGDGEGNPLPLPGLNAEEGDSPIVGTGSAQPGLDGSAQVPYVEVYPQYLEAYLQALQSDKIPPRLRELVRDYFSALEP